MKIIVCLNCDVHAATALNLLFPYLKNHQVKIVLSDGVGKNNNLPDEILRLKKFERDSLLNLFEELNSKGLQENNKFKTFNQIAQIFGSEIFSYSSVNSAKAIADFKNFAPDLIISIRFGNIFKSEIIAIPTKGILNLHSGILPNFRGIMSSFWAVLKGCDVIGSTLHYIDNSQIDVGDIIKINYLNLDKSRSLVFNINKLYDEGVKSIIDAIKSVESDLKLSCIKQDDIKKGDYFSYPSTKEVADFLKIMPLYKEEDGVEILSKWIS